MIVKTPGLPALGSGVELAEVDDVLGELVDHLRQVPTARLDSVHGGLESSTLRAQRRLEFKRPHRAAVVAETDRLLRNASLTLGFGAQLRDLLAQVTFARFGVFHAPPRLFKGLDLHAQGEIQRVAFRLAARFFDDFRRQDSV